MLTVCTGWSPSGYKTYGKRFAETFARFWPEDVQLVVYGEEPCELPRGEFRLLSSIGGAAEFRARWKDDPVANGRKPAPGREWKSKRLQEGYNFRFDAWKFSPQGFIPFDTARRIMGGYLCWLDGDVYTHKKVPSGFIESLLPADKHVAYLGRGDKHSEIGFQLYRIPEALQMVTTFKDFYASDRLFSLKEWHSAYVFDHARKVCGIAGHDLTPGGYGNVFDTSILGRYLMHLKGKRKGNA